MIPGGCGFCSVANLVGVLGERGDKNNVILDTISFSILSKLVLDRVKKLGHNDE